jgi:hypothetical protein
MVSIGTQCWTQENLRVTKYRDGSAIPDETSGSWSVPPDGSNDARVCILNNDFSYAGRYDNHEKLGASVRCLRD